MVPPTPEKTAMKRFLSHLLFATTLTAFALPPTVASAAFEGYLDVKFQTQGKLKGSSAKKGQTGKVRIIAVSHEIVSPRDAASGLPTGKRQHKPLRLTMELGAWATQFNSALVNNENLQTLDLAVMEGNAHIYTINLQNASVAQVAFKANGEGKPTMEVAFTYQKITWTWVDGGITAEDDWEAPVAAAAPPKPPKKPK
jgi:type VI secretion system secreted protein Hcp